MISKIDKEKKYHVHISSTHKWYKMNIKEIFEYRDLIWLFIKRNYALTFKQTILGPIWIFLNPFITSVVFAFVFGGIAGISTDGVPQILFYMSSNALWTFFAECVNKNSGTFVTNANLFGKVYFPRLTVPISNAFSSAIRFCIQMVMIVIFLVYYIATGAIVPNWNMWIWIPITILQLGLLGTGVGIVISSLTTKYRDLFIVVGFGIQLWMYATPIVYPLSQLENGIIRNILLINPATMPIELFRYALFGEGTIVLESVILSWCVTFVVVIFGMMVFNHVEKTFMDTV